MFRSSVLALALVSCSEGPFASGVMDERAPRALDEMVMASARAAQPEPASSASQGVAEGIPALVGSYRFVGGEAQRRAIDDAIEEVVSEMNVLVRSIARDRLKASNKAPQRVAFERKGDVVAVRIDDRTFEAPLGGGAVQVKSSLGDPLALRHEFKHSKLVQTFEGEDGGRINAFSVSDSGTVKLHVTVHSEKLPRDIRYQLSFRRDDG